MKIVIKYDFMLPIQNNSRIKRFIGKILSKICLGLYDAIEKEASLQNMYTYEVRSESKAYKIFLQQEFDFENEEVAWKEILIYLINTKEKSQLLDFIKSIKPLEFDIAMVNDFIISLGNSLKRIEISEEVETLYSELDDKGERLEIINIVGDPSVSFDDEDDEEDEDDEYEDDDGDVE